MSASPKVFHRILTCEGQEIFYREAGHPADPAILLMHGFPSSSHMFRRLIPALAQEGYYVVAPDLPGFGYSSYPAAAAFPYTFENFSRIISAFVEKKGLKRFALYLHDYGSTIGMRVALKHPEKITALIFQDGNSYEEGLGKEWDTAKAYWEHPTKANRDQLPEWLNAAGTRQQYLAGIPADQIPLFSPDTWTLDWALMSRPGHVEAQFVLFEDYQHNRAYFPQFQAFFRETQLPTVVIWGKYDVYFSVAEAACYRRDLPDAEIHVLEAGHKALESHFEAVSGIVLAFLKRHFI